MTHEFLWIVRLAEFWVLRRSAESSRRLIFRTWLEQTEVADERIQHQSSTIELHSKVDWNVFSNWRCWSTNRFGYFNQIFFTTVTEVWVFRTRLHDRKFSKFCSTRVKSSVHDTRTLCRITKLVHTVQRPNFECQNGWQRRWLQVHNVTCNLTSSLPGNVQLELVSP